MPRLMLIPMRDADGVAYTWRVERSPILCEGTTSSYRCTAWCFTDHTGYERFGGETWLQLVQRFSDVAANYGLSHKLS